MPYIKDNRPELEWHFSQAHYQPSTEGELNYLITKHVKDFVNRMGGVHYVNINEVIGVLFCAALEYYRTTAAPYEDKKIAENGDVL